MKTSGSSLRRVLRHGIQSLKWTILIVVVFIIALDSLIGFSVERGSVGLKLGRNGEVVAAINPCGIPVDAVSVESYGRLMEYDTFRYRRDYFELSLESGARPSHVESIDLGSRIANGVTTSVQAYKRQLFWYAGSGPTKLVNGGAYPQTLHELKSRLDVSHVLISEWKPGIGRVIHSVSNEEFQQCPHGRYWGVPLW